MLKLFNYYLHLFYIFLQKIINSNYTIFIILGIQILYFIEDSSIMLCDDGTGGNSNEIYTYRSIYSHPNTNIESPTPGVGQYNAYDPALQPTSQGYRVELDSRPAAYELDAMPAVYELDGRPTNGKNSTLLGEYQDIGSDVNNSYAIGEIPLTQSEMNAYNHYRANVSQGAVPTYVHVPSTLEKIIGKAHNVYKKVEKWEKEGHLKRQAEHRRLIEEDYRRRCLRKVSVNRSTVKDLKRSGFIIDKSNEITKKGPKFPNLY